MIVIPMAGMSSRFLDAGYQQPKFMLPLWDGFVFDYAAASFSNQFAETEMLFITRETGGVANFLDQRVRALGIEKPRYCILDEPTAGQAETVEIGLDETEVPAETPITVFNIDTFRMPWSQPQGVPQDVDGWLEVFRGDGDNWSFVKPAEAPGLAAETSEKVPISELCCTGLYHFSTTTTYRDALEIERKKPSSRELFIAPIYNHLIARGDRVGYGVIEREDVTFCGVPKEYEGLLDRSPPYSMLETVAAGEAANR